MAQGLMAYSDGLVQEKVKDLRVTIEQAENGYIFKLTGSKEVPHNLRAKDFYNAQERFEATFVYGDLQEGLKEVDGFFKAMEKILDKKVEARKKTIKKEVKK